jgi:hypothetical protein
MNLAVYCTGHGYGHLTRSMAVVQALKVKIPELIVHLRLPFPAELVLGHFGGIADSYKEIKLDIGLVQIDSLHHDLEASIKKLDFYYGSEGDKLVEAEAEWLINNKIDFALLDTPPRAFDACALANIPAFAVASFGWDDIWNELAADDSRMTRFADLASKSYNSISKTFRTPMNLGMKAFPNIVDVPLVVRQASKSIDEVRNKLDLPSDKPLVLLAYGGEGFESVILPSKSLMKKVHLIFTEPMKSPNEDFIYITDNRLSTQNVSYSELIKAVDIAMIKPGYSTVAECVAQKTAVIYTPRDSFPEAKTIQNYIHNNLPFSVLPEENLRNGEWEEAIDNLLDRFPLTFNDIPANGAEIIAKNILDTFKK